MLQFIQSFMFLVFVVPAVTMGVCNKKTKKDTDY